MLMSLDELVDSPNKQTNHSASLRTKPPELKGKKKKNTSYSQLEPRHSKQHWAWKQSCLGRGVKTEPSQLRSRGICSARKVPSALGPMCYLLIFHLKPSLDFGANSPPSSSDQNPKMTKIRTVPEFQHWMHISHAQACSQEGYLAGTKCMSVRW